MDPTDIVRTGIADAFSGLRSYSDGMVGIAKRQEERAYNERQTQDSRAHSEAVRQRIRGEGKEDRQAEDLRKMQIEAAQYGIDPRGKTPQELSRLIFNANLQEQQNKAGRDLDQRVKELQTMDLARLRETAKGFVDDKGVPMIQNADGLQEAELRAQVTLAARRTAEQAQLQKIKDADSAISTVKTQPQYGSLLKRYKTLLAMRSQAMVPMIPDMTPELTSADKVYLGKQIAMFAPASGIKLQKSTQDLFESGNLSAALGAMKPTDQAALGMILQQNASALLEKNASIGMKAYLSKVAHADDMVRRFDTEIGDMMRYLDRPYAQALLTEDVDALYQQNIDETRSTHQKNQAPPLPDAPGSVVAPPSAPGTPPPAAEVTAPVGPEAPFREKDSGVAGMANLFNPMSRHNIANRVYGDQGGITGKPPYADQGALSVLANPTTENSAIMAGMDAMKRFGIRRNLSGWDNWDQMTPEQQAAAVEEARRYDPIIQYGLPDYSQFR